MKNNAPLPLLLVAYFHIASVVLGVFYLILRWYYWMHAAPVMSIRSDYDVNPDTHDAILQSYTAVYNEPGFWAVSVPTTQLFWVMAIVVLFAATAFAMYEVATHPVKLAYKQPQPAADPVSA